MQSIKYVCAAFLLLSLSAVYAEEQPPMLINVGKIAEKLLFQWGIAALLVALVLCAVVPVIRWRR